MAKFTANSSFNMLDAGFIYRKPDEPGVWSKSAMIAGTRYAASVAWDTTAGDTLLMAGRFTARSLDKGEVRLIAQFGADGGQLWTLTGIQLKPAQLTAALDAGGVSGALAAALAGDDTVSLSFQNDVMYGFGGRDKIYGNGGEDRIYGGTGADFLWGGAGNDELQGGDGDDMLRGDADKDMIFGGAGRDKIYGGAGADLLFGGEDKDRDTFVFLSITECADATGVDTIREFVSGVDRIDLYAIDANVNAPGNQAFRFIAEKAFSGQAGELRFASGTVYGDVNGDGVADFMIKLPDLQTMSAADFAL